MLSTVSLKRRRRRRRTIAISFFPCEALFQISFQTSNSQSERAARRRYIINPAPSTQQLLLPRVSNSLTHCYFTWIPVMEPTPDGLPSCRSGAVHQPRGSAVESLQFHDEIQRLITLPPPPQDASFTALLELPPVQALQLLHSSSNVNAADFHLSHVKHEPLDTLPDSVLINGNPSPPPLVSNSKSVKRKERDREAKGASKRTKKDREADDDDDDEKLTYVHVRARRGQATDSHSLAERARREKINARMKLLQELVPGCNKISGTALVLDEIINHVQSLQRQVEFLSMRLAAVNPKIDFNMDSLLAAESGSFMDSNFPSMLSHIAWPEAQINGNRLQCPPQWQYDTYHQPLWIKEEENLHQNFLTPENSLLSYDSSANSASILPNQLKMEL